MVTRSRPTSRGQGTLAGAVAVGACLLAGCDFGAGGSTATTAVAGSAVGTAPGSVGDPCSTLPDVATLSAATATALVDVGPLNDATCSVRGPSASLTMLRLDDQSLITNYVATAEQGGTVVDLADAELPGAFVAGPGQVVTVAGGVLYAVTADLSDGEVGDGDAQAAATAAIRAWVNADAG